MSEELEVVLKKRITTLQDTLSIMSKTAKALEEINELRKDRITELELQISKYK